MIRELVARHCRRSTGRAVDDVILGCANQAGEDNRNVARMALLLGGLPEHVLRQHGQPALRLRARRRGHRGPRRIVRPARPTW